MADDAFAAAVAAIIGPENVLSAAADMAPYLEDWRGRRHGSARLVARPGSAAEVSALVRLCAQAGVPIVPQGGNTGLCAAATPDETFSGLLLRLDRMRRVRAISQVDAAITVEAGCVLADAQQAAAAAGMLLPLSLGAEGSCQIGGNISTNAGGITVLRYGTMRELVLGIEVVLPDGRLCDWLSPLRKNNAGYDLKQLFIGAEGTLGVITAAALRLFAPPRQLATAMVAISEPDAAAALLARVRGGMGERLSSFEFINRAQADIALAHVPGTRSPFAQTPPYLLLIEVGDTLAGEWLSPALESLLTDALGAGEIEDAVIAQSAAQAEAMWRLRHSISEANRRAGFGVSHDTAVPPGMQARFVHEIEVRMEASFPGVPLLLVGHIGDGNIHVVLLLDRSLHSPRELAARAAVANRIVDAVTMELGGTVSAEHGIGRSNKARLLSGRGAADLSLMRELKTALDPNWLMNPGALFDRTG